ncbi:MAG: bifunctional 5,10-methylenetetrahydrofolate dehydrogenase/5,10-methenyltetrahydrofolate cyclohydrolase [Pseudomonadales bacterium]|nr:bifunctional 5,10-methylenetetrahydrofolate dehydrogenase/5,10-methenyltetrahydrofolate cyclohydrolase [Pseudomonadales bacterium]
MKFGHKVINGRDAADKMLSVLKEEVDSIRARGWQPSLASVTVGDVDEVKLYVRNQKRFAARIGIEFEERQFASSISEAELRAAIATMNVDPRVTGIIIQRPVPDHISIRSLQETIHPFKDVEGMHPSSIGKIVYGSPEMGPCTAMAAVHLLKSTGVELEGLEVCVVGHSEIVGKPIAFLLMAEGATVTVCHHMTRSVANHSLKADVVFVAVGQPGLITGDMIKPGSIIIDIGINQVSDHDGKTKVVGDADFESCAEVADWITPVPGGVGPMTVAYLMKNAVVGVNRQSGYYEDLLGQNTLTPT